MEKLIERTIHLLFLVFRRVIYTLLYLFGSVFPRNKIIILCYHSIGNDPWRYSVSLDRLTRQMVIMLRHYQPVRLTDIVDYIKGKKTFPGPVFAVSFDDGYKDILQSTELFSHYGIYPTAFVLSDSHNVDSLELGVNREFLQTDDIHQLISFGWQIGSHGATHTDFYSLTHESAHFEIAHSKLKLEGMIGASVPFIAYPKGRYTQEAMQFVKDAGYEAAFSMDDRVITVGGDAFSIPRIGIDTTHNDIEFEATVSLPAVYMRSLVKLLDKWNALRKKRNL